MKNTATKILRPKFCAVNCAPEIMCKKKIAPLTTQSDAIFFGRCQPDSNWCRRFCRPLPNHSDMAPFPFCAAKLRQLFESTKFFANFFFILVSAPLFLRLGKPLRNSYLKKLYYLCIAKYDRPRPTKTPMTHNQFNRLHRTPNEVILLTNIG